MPPDIITATSMAMNYVNQMKCLPSYRCTDMHSDSYMSPLQKVNPETLGKVVLCQAYFCDSRAFDHPIEGMASSLKTTSHRRYGS